MHRLLWFLGLGLLSCSDSIDASIAKCDVVLKSTEPSATSVGETVIAYGGPLTERIDTALFLDSIRVEVVSIERENCEECDECRIEQGCSDCSDCPACGSSCDNDCSESILFAVPDVEPGEHELLFFNAHGSSNTLGIEVIEPSQDDSTDEESQPSDTGPGDSTG